jgi:hypothetical protein
MTASGGKQIEIGSGQGSCETWGWCNESGEMNGAMLLRKQSLEDISSSRSPQAVATIFRLSNAYFLELRNSIICISLFEIIHSLEVSDTGNQSILSRVRLIEVMKLPSLKAKAGTGDLTPRLYAGSRQKSNYIL